MSLIGNKWFLHRNKLDCIIRTALRTYHAFPNSPCEPTLRLDRPTCYSIENRGARCGLDFLNEFIVLYDLLNFHEACEQAPCVKVYTEQAHHGARSRSGERPCSSEAPTSPHPRRRVLLRRSRHGNEVFKHAAEKCSEISKRFPRFLRIGCLSGIEDESMALVKQTINQIQGRTSKKIILLELSLSPDRLFSDLVAGRRDFVFVPDLGPIPSTVSSNSTCRILNQCSSSTSL